jgi:hypothetical protein
MCTMVYNPSHFCPRPNHSDKQSHTLRADCFTSLQSLVAPPPLPQLVSRSSRKQAFSQEAKVTLTNQRLQNTPTDRPSFGDRFYHYHRRFFGRQRLSITASHILVSIAPVFSGPGVPRIAPLHLITQSTSAQPRFILTEPFAMIHPRRRFLRAPRREPQDGEVLWPAEDLCQ